MHIDVHLPLQTNVNIFSVVHKFIEESTSSEFGSLYILPVNCYIIYLFCMTACIRLRRGTSKLLELVPIPFDQFNKLCSKHQNNVLVIVRSIQIQINLQDIILYSRINNVMNGCVVYIILLVYMKFS